MNDLVLPEGWAEAPLGELFAINPARPRANSLAPGIPVSFVPMGALDAESGTIVSPQERPFGVVRKGYTAFADGDVILAKITPCFENGKAAIARELLNGHGFGSSEFHVFRPRESVIAEYLFHFLRQRSFRDDGVEHMTGTAGQARVPAEFVKSTVLPVPPLAEQRRIVEQIEALLARANAARERLGKLPSIVKRFRQSVLAAACAGRLTEDWRARHPELQVPSIPSTNAGTVNARRRGANLSGDQDLLVDDEMPALPDLWTYARVDRLIEPGTVITYGIVLPGPETPGGVPYVRQQDIENGHVLVEQLRRTSPEIAGRHERSRLQAGDVLLCIIRNLRVAVVPEGIDGANLTQGTVRIRARSDFLLNSYLAAYLASPQAQGWMKRRYFGMDMPRINVEDARAVPVALPSPEEQREIVLRVRNLFDLADAIERRVGVSIARADRLIQATLAKAFRGELVPTEAEVARNEGRDYEPASALLERLRARPMTPQPENRRTAGRRSNRASRTRVSA